MSFETELTTLLDTAMTKMRGIVEKPSGSTPASKTFRRARAAQLVQQIDRIRGETVQGASAVISGELLPLYRKGLADGFKQARAAGVRGPAGMVAGSFSALDREPLLVIVRSTVEDVSRAVASAGERAKSVLRQTAAIGLSNRDINTVIASGVIAGTPLAAAREIREQLRAIHGDTLPVIDKNGDVINFAVGDYAKMLVRTRTREAVVKGSHRRYSSMGVDLVKIVGRVSNSFCTAYLYKVYSLSGKHPTYPALSELPDGPPFHPNCSKSTAPYIEALASDAEKAIAAPGDDSDKLVGVKDTSKLQRMYKDLQLRTQVEARNKAAQKAARGAA